MQHDLQLGQLSVQSQALLDPSKGLCSWSSTDLQSLGRTAFGSTPELNAAPSISTLASHSYDGLDLETICFPSACIQLSLGQQSPFELQPQGMGVGRLLHWLLSGARKKGIWLETHTNDPFLAARGKTGRTRWWGQPEQ